MKFTDVCKTVLGIVSILIPIHFMPMLCEPVFKKYWQHKLEPRATITAEDLPPQQPEQPPVEAPVVKRSAEDEEWCKWVRDAMGRDDPELTLSDRSHYVQDCQ